MGIANLKAEARALVDGVTLAGEARRRAEAVAGPGAVEGLHGKVIMPHDQLHAVADLAVSGYYAGEEEDSTDEEAVA